MPPVPRQFLTLDIVHLVHWEVYVQEHVLMELAMDIASVPTQQQHLYPVIRDGHCLSTHKNATASIQQRRTGQVL